jgi:hypothetical protein
MDDTNAPIAPSQLPHAEASTPEPARRAFLRDVGRGLGAAALAALATTTAAAQSAHQHGHAQDHAHGHGHGGMRRAADAITLPAQAVPWADGVCAFCGMTIATPAGAPQGEGFRERTYAQWVTPGADDEPQALHFESIACALNHAYVHGVRHGQDGTLYVSDAAGSLPAAAEGLVDARRAVFHWGEGLQVAMMARLIAFADDDGRAAHMAAHPDEGRTERYGLQTLEDLAPLPEMNLIRLLARHAGLLDA